MKNIREVLRKFNEDEDEIHVSSTDTNKGVRNNIFLTEKGLYITLNKALKENKVFHGHK